jgi:hypothetical protein
MGVGCAFYSRAITLPAIPTFITTKPLCIEKKEHINGNQTRENVPQV